MDTWNRRWTDWILVSVKFRKDLNICQSIVGLGRRVTWSKSCAFLKNYLLSGFCSGLCFIALCSFAVVPQWHESNKRLVYPVSKAGKQREAQHGRTYQKVRVGRLRKRSCERSLTLLCGPPFRRLLLLISCEMDRALSQLCLQCWQQEKAPPAACSLALTLIPH